MKKSVFLIIILSLILTGCKNITNTPSAKVENFMEKYQNMDSSILNKLDSIITSPKLSQSELNTEN